MKELQKQLFEFAKQADHLTEELRAISVTDPNIETIFALQDHLRVIARKAEGVASIVGQMEQV